MKFEEQKILGSYLIQHDLIEDERGIFRRSYCAKTLKKNNIHFEVKQGNISENKKKYTLRGFHYQKGVSTESKILTCISGRIYNVVIDLRKDSSSYKSSFALELNKDNRLSLFVPSGCANAYLTLENNTIINYYMGDFYNPETYSGFRYNDPMFNIEWPVQPVFISEKDLNFPNYNEK